MYHRADSQLPFSLKIYDTVDKVRIPPRFPVAESVVQSDDISRGFFDDSIAMDLELAQDGCLAGARGSSENKIGHDETPIS